MEVDEMPIDTVMPSTTSEISPEAVPSSTTPETPNETVPPPTTSSSLAPVRAAAMPVLTQHGKVGFSYYLVILHYLL